MAAGRARLGPELARRRLLQAGAGGALAGVLAAPAAAAESFAAALARLLDGWTPVESAALRLELPAQFDHGGSVPLGLDLAPSVRARLRSLEVLAPGNPLPEVLGLAHLAPACQGPVTTRIRLQSGRQEVIALARLRDRPPLLARAWIEVGSDGCSTEAEVEAGYVPPPPQPRLRLPEPAAKGALIPVRSMIAHYMETGLRHDRHGTPIPRRIIHRVEGFYEDRLLLSATLQPAVAANAYLGFNLRAEAGGELELVWHEDGGAVYRLRQRLTVA